MWDNGIGALLHCVNNVTWREVMERLRSYESTWFSNERMMGYCEVLKALSAIASITSCRTSERDRAFLFFNALARLLFEFDYDSKKCEHEQNNVMKIPQTDETDRLRRSSLSENTKGDDMTDGRTAASMQRPWSQLQIYHISRQTVNWTEVLCLGPGDCGAPPALKRKCWVWEDDWGVYVCFCVLLSLHMLLLFDVHVSMNK